MYLSRPRIMRDEKLIESNEWNEREFARTRDNLPGRNRERAEGLLFNSLIKFWPWSGSRRREQSRERGSRFRQRSFPHLRRLRWIWKNSMSGKLLRLWNSNERRRDNSNWYKLRSVRTSDRERRPGIISHDLRGGDNLIARDLLKHIPPTSRRRDVNVTWNIKND